MAVSAAKQLQLYNDALGHCSDGALASLTERREPRRLLDRVWAGGPIGYTLEKSEWGFATKTARLDADTDIEPDFGMRFAYQHPDDWLRTVGISDNEYFAEKFNDFQDEGGYWYANIDKIYVRYISDDEAYGMDEAQWTKAFELYISAYMAWRIIPRLNDSRASRADMQVLMDNCLKEARGLDASSRPAVRMGSGTWNQARHGNRSGLYNGRR